MPKGVYERTKENKRKNSEAQKGKHLSEITKEKIRKSHIGKKHSQETRRKLSESRKGNRNPNWKGGQITSFQGYVLVLMPEHPRANSSGYVKRAYLVAEKMLGRYLYPEEISHHKNEIRNDDRPENIEVMTRGEHQSFHNEIRKKFNEAST